MLEKLKQYKNYYSYFGQFRDIRAAGMLVFLFVVLLTSWSGVKVIQTNYELQKQISRLEQENQIQQLQDNNLTLQNEYYNTDQYLELSARQNFGLGAPGETELLIPRSVALAHTVTLDNSVSKSIKASIRQPDYQKNFEAWINFLLHRGYSN
jgi:cell division protein FtsB